MSIGSIIITGLEIVISALLIYGFMNEDKVIRWEQKQVRKIKRFIYNLIVKLEG